MIYLRVTQRKVPIDRARIVRDLERILEILDYSDFALGVLITNNPTIRKYNREYRDKDKPTDVLSFPAYPDLKAGERIMVEQIAHEQEDVCEAGSEELACCADEQCSGSEDGKELGDLILSAEYIVEEARKHNVTFEERMRLLLVHGICHLLGYDHIEDDDFRRMRQKEAWILKKLAEYQD